MLTCGAYLCLQDAIFIIFICTVKCSLPHPTRRPSNPIHMYTYSITVLPPSEMAFLLLLSTYRVGASAMVLSNPSPRVEAEGEDGAWGCEQQAKQYKLHHLSVKLKLKLKLELKLDRARGCEQDAKQYKLHHISVKFAQHRVMVVRIAMKMINDFRPAGLTL